MPGMSLLNSVNWVRYLYLTIGIGYNLNWAIK